MIMIIWKVLNHWKSQLARTYHFLSIHPLPVLSLPMPSPPPSKALVWKWNFNRDAYLLNDFSTTWSGGVVVPRRIFSSIHPIFQQMASIDVACNFNAAGAQMNRKANQNHKRFSNLTTSSWIFSNLVAIFDVDNWYSLSSSENQLLFSRKRITELFKTNQKLEVNLFPYLFNDQRRNSLKARQVQH